MKLHRQDLKLALKHYLLIFALVITSVLSARCQENPKFKGGHNGSD